MVETFTIRIYNSQRKKDIEESYKRCKDYYPSKNAFLMDCMVRGVFNVERDIFGIKNVKDIDELYVSKNGKVSSQVAQMLKDGE